MDYSEIANSNSMKYMSLGTKLERITLKIFEMSGYDVEMSSHTSDKMIGDFVAKRKEEIFFIEIKASTTLNYNQLYRLGSYTSKLVNAARENSATPVLCVYSLLREDFKDFLKLCYKELVILDLANILYAVNGTNLHSELIMLLPFSVDQVEYKAGNIDLGWSEHSDDSDELLLELDNCLAGRKQSSKFEDICNQILKYVFFSDLALWRIQIKSNKDLYRFDLLCRIKDNTEVPFWSMIERFFNTKYVIFEYKNYSNKITQKEIYTTERYLYNKALRNFAIIIAKNGFDNNSIWACKGCLRENGKLILLLSTDDLKEMYRLRKKQQDPSELLQDKLDDLLMDLEK